MSHHHRKAVLLAALTLLAPSARGQDVKKAAVPATALAGPKVRELHVDPAPAPYPVLKYRLLPIESDRTPGNAAPVYLRISHEMREAVPKLINEKHGAWIDAPTGPFPVLEARGLVDQFSTRLEQLDFGARRKRCDWDYTLSEQKERAIEILLPDAQQMRTWSRLLVIKARTEIAEHNYPAAIRTIETGISFGRHVAEGPFVINNLVGIAICSQMMDCVEKLIAEPDAPNLYWALTALPRPLVNIRAAMETEQRMGEYVIPEITDLDRPRTDAEWTSLLDRLVDRLNALARMMRDQMPGGVNGKQIKAARLRDELLPKARAAFEGRPGLGTMSDDRAVVLYIAEKYRAMRDDAFKYLYLPLPDAIALRTAAARPPDDDKAMPFGLIGQIVPRLDAAHFAETRLQLWVDSLRVVEALRMTAAQAKGELPLRLANVAVVPIPVNPVTGKPFEYSREPGGAVLIGAVPSIPVNGFHYRISIRR
jgi:hypothetical protein